MPKTVNSSVRKILYSIINKYNEVKSERDTVFNENVQLFTITDECINDPMKIETILSSINKLKDLEYISIYVIYILKSETQYLEKISAMTGVCMSTLSRVKKEGSLNNRVWDIPGKVLPHKLTVSYLDDFDMNVLLNKVNEFYIVKKL